MTNDALLQRFSDCVEQPQAPNAIAELAKRLQAAGRKAKAEDRMELAAAVAHAAFLAPDEVGATYDALACGWTGNAVKAAPITTLNLPPEPAPAVLWSRFWAVVEDAQRGALDATSITVRTAELGGLMPPEFVDRVVTMSHTYPGVTEAARAEFPRKIELATLAEQPQDSLGAEYHEMVVENGFDLEVLERDDLGLAQLPPPLDYLNTRILQAHDLWHLTAGYKTTALHEIAISAFQLAQFGHSYSAQFLAVTVATGAKGPTSGFRLLMDMITSAWTHGRETPPLMLVPWESVWHNDIGTIRSNYQISPYESPHRPDLIEKAAPLFAVSRFAKNALNRIRGAFAS